MDAHLVDMLSFFQDDMPAFIDKVNVINKDFYQIIDDSKLWNEDDLGNINRYQNIFEVSLQKLNRMIAVEIEKFNSYAQHIFPSYFEKFRTDGIEYDLYVGQSITPAQIFDVKILKKLRMQQIITMATIAKQVHHLAAHLPIPLQTTQLIFVHPNRIDISFRQDERRFDVEGGYNIRYQIIKKRIDKVLIADTKQRLVQPNMIAIVYSSASVEEELKISLQQIIASGLIHPEIEHLNLEELQGVSELKALRVRVILDN